MKTGAAGVVAEPVAATPVGAEGAEVGTTGMTGLEELGTTTTELELGVATGVEELISSEVHQYRMME